MALIGTVTANSRRGNHIITTCIEHPSVYEPLRYLQKQGFEVTYLPVSHEGKVQTEALAAELRKDTILVSIVYVNNEIGVTQDIPGLGRILHKTNPGILFHTDAVQAYGKYNIIPKKEGIDLMSVSAHKLNGPKGVGFLYCRDGVKINPILLGGGQQRAMRSGTENVPGIAGMAAAVESAFENRENKVQNLYSLKEGFIRDLNQEIQGVTINGCNSSNSKDSAPHIVSVSFEGVKSEVLLHALEDKGIFVSSGSACAANHPGISSVLKAVGVREHLLDSTLRFSFSFDTTAEQLAYTIEVLKELVPVLRKYKRRR